MTVAAKKAPAKKPAAKRTAPAKKAAPAAKTAAAPALAFEMPSFELPGFEMPETLIPEGAMEMAEKSLASARDAFDKTAASVEEQGAAIEKSFESATESAKELNKKAVDAAKSNMEAGFGFLTEMLSAKTFSDVIELQTSFAGKQFEVLSAQSKEFQDTVTKGIEVSSAPVKAAAEKAMEAIKAA